MALTQVTGPYPIFTDLDGTPLDDGYLYIGEVNDDPETNPIQVYWDANLTIPASQPIRTNSGYAYRNGTPALIYTAGQFSITIRNKREEFVLYSPVGYGFDPAAVSASVVKNDFTGDGVEVNFALSAAPSTILATNVFINGVYQEKDSYSLLGNVITFSIAPPLSSSIEVMTNETGVINSGNATAISYTASFPGATAQTVQTKLEQYVSVKDFGAVGDGVTDDTAAIQAAVDSGAGEVVFPTGSYRLKMIFIDVGNVRLIGQNATIIQYHDNVNSIPVNPGEYKVSAAFFTKRGCVNVEITGFTFTTNDASFPALAAGFGSYFPSIGGQFSDNVYIHHNNFQGGQDRCMFFQAGKNLRFENNNVEDNGFTVHIGYLSNVYFYDNSSDTSIKYSPIAPSFVNNVFDGFSSDRSAICAHLTGCTEFVCRDNRFLNMSIGSFGSLKVLRLYSNDFGPYDENGNQLSYIQGICSGNVINGTFDHAIEVDGDSTAASSTWTSSYNMRILVEGNNIQGTGNGIKTNEIQNTKFVGNFVNVTESAMYMTGRMVYCNISNNTFTSTAGGYNDTMFYSSFGGGSGWITFNNNRVNASALSQYLFNENVTITWFICNENNFFFDGDVANSRPIILRIANKAWFKNNVFNIETNVALASVLVLTGSGTTSSVNIEENHVFAANGTGASTIRFCSLTSFQDINIHNNVTGGPILVEDSDRTYITNNTIITPASNTARAIDCSNTAYAAKALVEIHSNYILSASATTTECVAIVSNNDASLNTTSKVTMNYISCNSSLSPLSQQIQGELGIIGNTLVNAGAGGTSATVTGSATLVTF
jgi:hypothetical protein